MRFKSVMITFLLICFASVTHAATDLSGTWLLNGKKGENLGMMSALKETLVATQTADLLTFDFTDTFRGNTTTRQVNLDLTGAPADNLAAMGAQNTTVSTWEGEKLVTTWTSVNAVGTEVVRTETHALTDDGTIMTVTIERANKPTMVMVYEKQ